MTSADTRHTDGVNDNVIALHNTTFHWTVVG
jgi:hypothetical protein